MQKGRVNTYATRVLPKGRRRRRFRAALLGLRSLHFAEGLGNKKFLEKRTTESTTSLAPSSPLSSSIASSDGSQKSMGGHSAMSTVTPSSGGEASPFSGSPTSSGSSSGDTWRFDPPSPWSSLGSYDPHSHLSPDAPVMSPRAAEPAIISASPEQAVRAKPVVSTAFRYPGTAMVQYEGQKVKCKHLFTRSTKITLQNVKDAKRTACLKQYGTNPLNKDRKQACEESADTVESVESIIGKDSWANILDNETLACFCNRHKKKQPLEYAKKKYKEVQNYSEKTLMNGCVTFFSMESDAGFCNSAHKGCLKAINDYESFLAGICCETGSRYRQTQDGRQCPKEDQTRFTCPTALDEMKTSLRDTWHRMTGR